MLYFLTVLIFLSMVIIAELYQVADVPGSELHPGTLPDSTGGLNCHLTMVSWGPIMNYSATLTTTFYQVLIFSLAPMCFTDIELLTFHHFVKSSNESKKRTGFQTLSLKSSNQSIKRTGALTFRPPLGSIQTNISLTGKNDYATDSASHSACKKDQMCRPSMLQ